MDENLANSILSLMTSYQAAFQTFWEQNRGNKDFTIQDAKDMTRDFWNGTMIGTGMAASSQKPDNPMGF